MPLLNEVRYDPVLSTLAVGYKPDGYVADEVLLPLPVKMEDGTYWKFGMERFYSPDALRAPRSRYRQIDWKMTRDSYHAEEYGLEQPIDDRERSNSSLPADLDTESTEILTENLKNGKEKRVANLVRSTSNITQNVTLAGATQWSDASGGDPIGVSITAHGTIRAATGQLATDVVLGYAVWEKLQTNPKIKAELAEGEQIALARLARLWNVQRIHVGRLLTATNKKGQAVTLGDVWGKDVLFYYRAPRPGMRRFSLGYQFRVQDYKTFRYRKPDINSDVIRVNEIIGEKLVAAQLGYLVKNAVA